MRLSRDRIGAVLLGLFCLTYTFLSFDIPRMGEEVGQAMTARSMPLALGIIGCILCFCLLVRAPINTSLAWRSFSWGRLFSLIALMSVYGISMRPLGFVLASVILLYVGFLVMGTQRRIQALIVAWVITLAFWGLLNFGLGVYLPGLPELFTRGTS